MRLLSDNFCLTKSCYWTVSNISDPWIKPCCTEVPAKARAVQVTTISLVSSATLLSMSMLLSAAPWVQATGHPSQPVAGGRTSPSWELNQNRRNICPNCSIATQMNGFKGPPPF